MFTKQHYREIAGIIYAEREHCDSPLAVEKLCNVAEQLAAMFKRDNPRFRRDVFLTACREGLDAVSTFPERGTKPPREARRHG